MKSIILALSCLLILSQCKNESTNTSAQRSPVMNAGSKSFGALITEEGSVSADMVPSMMKADSMKMKITGKVTQVCQAKGCWMNIVSASGAGTPIFVQFKDYAYFMPKDCSGKKVTIEGIVYKSITPIEELRHYAEDKGATKEEIAAITMPKEELKFMADGVILHDNN